MSEFTPLSPSELPVSDEPISEEKGGVEVLSPPPQEQSPKDSAIVKLTKNNKNFFMFVPLFSFYYSTEKSRVQETIFANQPSLRVGQRPTRQSLPHFFTLPYYFLPCHCAFSIRKVFVSPFFMVREIVSVFSAYTFSSYSSVNLTEVGKESSLVPVNEA